MGKFYIWPLVHFVVIWYIFPVLVCFIEKNLATLLTGGKIAPGCFPLEFSRLFFEVRPSSNWTSRKEKKKEEKNLFPGRDDRGHGREVRPGGLRRGWGRGTVGIYSPKTGIYPSFCIHKVVIFNCKI
jgi:hypothetical protein